MDQINIDQPKEIVTTVSARCVHCGTVWDISRIVETKNDDGDLVETENVTVSDKCPRCFPNPVSPVTSEDATEAPEEETEDVSS